MSSQCLDRCLRFRHRSGTGGVRDAYVADCQRGVDRWNQILDKQGITYRLRLPSRRFHRHIGIYAYRVSALKRITRLPSSRLERIEKLEQLRALEAGMRIAVAIARAEPGPGVDTPADLDRIRTMPPPM